jgi:4-amino-4-deoxy-L-arabinose transferase-like glycosyltransferase
VPDSLSGNEPARMRLVMRGVVALVLVTFFFPALFVASVMPYRLWDSLAFGTWSRLIEETGDLFPAGLIDLSLHRPLFYISQGLLWEAFGHHEWLGRWLSVAFAGVAVAGIWMLATRIGRDRQSREVMRAIAVAGILGSSVFATYAAAGMADVPVAAMAAVTGAALWSTRLGRAYTPLVAIGAAATVLAKPTGLLALGGLALASVVLLYRRDDARRLGLGLGGLVLGAALGLTYDIVQAHRLGETLNAFLRAGNSDFYLQQGRAARTDAVLGAAWLGEGVRLLVLFGVLFALARVAGAGGRLALAAAGPAAILWSIAGPAIADGATPYPFAHVGLSLAAYLLLAGSLLAAPWLPVDDRLSRRAYGALLLWAAPGVIAWLAYRADAERFLSPAWPALVLLLAAGLTVVVLTLVRFNPLVGLVPVAAVVLVVVGNVVSIDGLGGSGWRGLLDLGPDGWSGAAIENYAYGPFSYELDAARATVEPHDQIVSNDGRLTYFFPGRVDFEYPRTCDGLRRARFFAYLSSGESAEVARINGSSIEPLAWLQCAKPRLHLIGEQTGVYEAFAVGRPSPRAPTLSDCHIAPYAADLFDAVFARGVTYAKAREVQASALRSGFTGTVIEHTSCSTFRVVVRGVPADSKTQEDFRRETASVGFKIALVRGMRYPEVPGNVEPVPES